MWLEAKTKRVILRTGETPWEEQKGVGCRRGSACLMGKAGLASSPHNRQLPRH